jgi:hypothetical protein
MRGEGNRERGGGVGVGEVRKRMGGVGAEGLE